MLPERRNWDDAARQLAGGGIGTGMVPARFDASPRPRVIKTSRDGAACYLRCQCGKGSPGTGERKYGSVVPFRLPR